MTTKTRVTITIASDLCVVGYNPEGADLDRPRGEIIREVFFLVAEDARGNRWEWGQGWRQEADAEAAIATAPPVILWSPGRPAYGSEAYVAYGAADDLAWEARLQQAEDWGFDTRFGAF